MFRTFLGSLLLVSLAAEPANAVGSLDAARDAFHAGSFDVAASALRGALEGDQDLDASDRADARHLLGRTLMATGEHAQAALVLSQALQADDAEDTTALEDHLRYHLAMAMHELGRHTEARPLFRAVARDPHSPFQVQAAFYEATSLLEMDRKPAARRAFVTFLATYPGAPRMHDARVSLATLEAARGRDARAIVMLRRVIRHSPQSKAASRAQLTLDDLAAKGRAAARRPTELEVRKDAEWLVSERRFDEALPVLLRLRKEAKRKKDKEGRLALSELLVRTYRGLGMLDKTLEMSAWVKRRRGDGLGPSTTTFLMGLLDRHEDAEKLILRRFHRRKSASYWKTIGDHRMRFGRYQSAEKAFLRAAKKSGRWVPRELSRKIAWSVFNQGDAERAIDLLADVGRRNPKRRTWSKYWIARALQDAGHLDRAKLRYEALQARNETNFYGLMAGSRLQEMAEAAARAETGGDETPEKSVEATSEVDGQEADEAVAASAIQPAPLDIGTLRWTPQMLSIDASWEQALPAEPTRGDALGSLAGTWGKVAPEAIRAAELHRLGFLEEARDELRVLATDLRIMGKRKWRHLIGRGRSDMLDNRRDKRARGGAHIRHAGRRSRKQARAFFDAVRNGKFRVALQEAREVLGDRHAIRWKSVRGGILQQPIATGTVEDYRRAYPIAWPKAMSISTSTHDVPPAFLYGIMTTESSFHPHAVSVAHAYGLVQMIPRTGRRVALELGYGDFMPEVLLAPDPSIYMGGRYMGRLLDRFYDQEPLAAAAYNCGPHRVADWLKANPNRDLDVFVEEIPYGQARRYTKRVLSHTARYRRLYYGEDRMYVPNRLESRHRATPNY
jgi:TolA-binding protein